MTTKRLHLISVLVLGLCVAQASSPLAAISRPPEPYWYSWQALPAVAATAQPARQVAAPAPNSLTGTGDRYYTVQPGDTLSGIAQQFGTSVAALVQNNSLSSGDNVLIGQRLLINGPSAVAKQSLAAVATQAPENRYYYVKRNETLGTIAQLFDTTVTELVRVNGLADANSLLVGQRLLIPGSVPVPAQPIAAAAATATAKPKRGSVWDRLPPDGRAVGPDSPFYHTTWVTYYGSPGVGVMGILGEYNIDGLIPRLRAQAQAYAAINGADMRVQPAFHLIYGTATKAPGTHDAHLAYLGDSLVQTYIDRAAKESFGVILDVQIGNVTPLTSITPAFDFLKYNNVHLALDPEFAMTSKGQTIPGDPPGTITAGQINEVQWAMAGVMKQLGIQGHRMLVVHQFLPTMILYPESISEVDGIDVVICADGFGPPWPKISKYNLFMSDAPQFAGFKLFYRWDEPLMTEAQTMGVDPVPGIGYMEVSPSLVVYQ